MKIFALSPGIGSALASLGHDVMFPPPEPHPVLDVEEYLGRRGFVPELIFQEESLGPRVLLESLDAFDCPKIFWSLDTHLNLFWHAYYIRLFDGIMTPHISLFERIRFPHPPLLRLPHFGMIRPWRPHAERTCPVSFVGRITTYRPLRQWLAEFLQTQYQARIVQDVSLAEMLDIYCQTRLAPNESIMGEVNFRLLETASCGCLPFSQAIGPDQDVLFAPGKEIQTYGNVLELKELLDHFLARPELAERKARAAWERINREHLPIHRAKTVLEFAGQLGSAGARGIEAATALWLCIWAMRRAGRNAFPLDHLEVMLRRLPPTSEVLAARLGVLAWQRDEAAFRELSSRIALSEEYSTDLELNLACSTGALLFKDFNLARQPWYRYQRTRGPEVLDRPETPLQLCRLWARELAHEHVFVAPGTSFDPLNHLPDTALDCLYLALQYDPGNQDLLRQIDAIYARITGGEWYRLGLLSELSLHQRKNWRLGLTLGLVNLKAFRLQQGLEEITVAWNTALSQNKTTACLRVLKGLDPGGSVLRVIRAMAHASQTSPATAVADETHA